MAKLRKFQFYRNGQVQTIAVPETGVDLKSAYKQAEQDFIAKGKHNDMLDGEILLYRFSYNGTVHTLVGVVHVSGEVHSLEVLANYDMLGGEISDAISDAINALDAEVTDTNVKNDITVKVTQTDGKLTAVEVTDSLAEVAHTGAAANVSIADTEDVIEATTVEGALAEIAKEIDAMDYNVSDVEGFQPVAQGEKVKVTIQQKDGKITNVAVDETALKDALDELKNATTLEGVDAIKVDYNKTANTVSLKIADGEKVLSQDEDGLKSTISLIYDSATTTIYLKGINGADLGTIDASEFVKDGLLSDVSIVPGDGAEHEGQVLENGKRYFKFTYKTVYYDENGETIDSEKVVYLDVESLVDSYTSGNEWIVIDQTANTISHKTPTGLTTGTFGANTADATADAAGESVEFKVPSFTVDAAGHVTEASEKTVKVALPATRTADSVTVVKNETLGLTSENVQSALEELQTEINAINDVNWNGDGDGTGTGEIIVNDTDHTISHKQHTFEESESTNATAVKSVVIPKLTVNDYGHVTAIENQIFNIDFNVPTVSGTKGQIVVTPTEETEDVNYTVSLAEVARVDNPTAEGTAGVSSTSSFADNDTTFTYVKEVKTDNYGRVTGIVTETVTEDFDAGTY